MNWDRGIKRIILILSIVGAIIVATLGLYDSVRVLNHNKRILMRERESAYSEYDGSRLIEEWKQTKTETEQNKLWVKWAGFNLSEKPRRLQAIEELQRRGIKIEPEITEGLQKTVEELEMLKSQGWCTVNGEPLPETPKGVWLIQHRRRIKDLEETVWQDTTFVPIGTAFGGFLGFGFVWAAYAVTRWGALPLYKWVSVGFREDKTKNGQDRNESGTVGD